MLELKNVTPENSHWPTFIALYVEYFQRHWPSVFPDINSEEIAYESMQLLERRLSEGGRGIFLLFFEKEPVGLANVWLSKKQKTTLNIAEFYIRDEQQGRGLGNALWHAVLQWGRIHGATQLELETDSQKPSNTFWQSFGLQSVSKSLRIHYHGTIPPLRILFIRHGRILSLDGIDYCPPDDVLQLTTEAKNNAALIGAKLFKSKSWQPIYTSPQRRALETALALISCKDTAPSVIQNPDLCEFFPHELIGMKLKNIPIKYGKDYENIMLNFPLNNIFSESEKAEEAAERILSFIKNRSNSLLFDSRIIIVSHQNLHNLFVADIFGKNLNSSGRINLNNLHGSTFIYDPFNQRFDIENINIQL